MFDAGSGTGYAPVPGLAVLSNRSASLALVLDTRPPANEPEPALPGFVVIAAIGPEVPAAVATVEHVHKVPGIGLAGIAHLYSADELVPPVHAHG